MFRIDARTIFRYHLYSNALMCLKIILFKVSVSHPYVAVGNVHVGIIPNFILPSIVSLCR